MSSPNRLTAVLAGTSIMAGLTPTLALPVLGQIAVQQQVSTATVTWVLTASFLASAVSTPILGRFADIYGGRRVLLITLGTVLVGSVIAATTLNFALLLCGRVLQGGVSTLYPLCVSTVQHHMHGRPMTRAVSMISAGLGVGGVIGLVVAGLIGSGGDYRVIFWFPVGVAAVAMIAVALVVPKAQGRTGGSVDLGGCALLSAGLVLLLLPLSRGGEWGFGSPAVLGCFAASAVLLAAFVQIERHVPFPMVPLVMLRRRPLLTTNVVSVLVGFLSFVPLIVLPVLVQANPTIVGDGRPASPLVTALVYLLPGSALGLLGTPLGNRILRRSGPRSAMYRVSVVSVGACGMFALAPETPAVLIAGLALTTIALYIVYAALPHLVVPHVARGDLGVANGMNSLGRWVGSALVTAVMSLVLVAGPHGERIGETRFRLGFAFGVLAGALIGLVAWLGLRAGRGGTLIGDESAADDHVMPAPGAPGAPVELALAADDEPVPVSRTT